jgi:SAM-dependent methyltransferase
MLNKDIKSMDPIWEKIHKEGWGRYPSEDLVSFLCRYKKNSPDFKKHNKILDIGCGAGANTKMMIDEGFDVFALDGSKHAITNAKKLIYPRKAKFFVADFLDIDNLFAPDFFDIICDSVSIYANSTANINLILKKVAAILNKNGYFYSSCFSKLSIGQEKGKEIEKDTFIDAPSGVFKNRGLSHFYSEKSVRNLYGKYFKIESLDTSYQTLYNRTAKIGKFVLICRKKSNAQ